MTVLPALHRGRPAVRTVTRRRFLRCAAALLAGTLISPPPGRMSFAADADAQWARLQRGLSRETMAGCRKAADRLIPRLGVLLKGPQWESQTFKAIADELKQAGVYPDHPPPRSPDCAEAESLRGEAAAPKSSDGAIEAGLAAAAAATAMVPGVGPVIVAVLLAIAAVVILIGQIIAKALEDQAAAKEKDLAAAKKDQAAKKEMEEQATKIKKAQQRVTDEMARRDDCTLFGKKPD
jgi:Na+-transporting methylmalonyl-CoA/oxaloacetate decarboxylase gamma subunit